MADVGLAQAPSTNNGTATPATPGSLTLTNHNLAVLVIATLGTSPTIGTPAGWTLVKSISGTALSAAMFILPNQAGGATNPSSVLGGTVTGWVALMAELNQTGANEGLLNSAVSAQATAQLTNIFSGLAVIYNNLFIYAVARATATITPANTNGSWSASIAPIAGVQGLSLDVYWMSNQQQGYWPPPSASGLLSSAVNSVQIGAILNSLASTATVNTTDENAAGQLVGSFYQGMIGG